MPDLHVINLSLDPQVLDPTSVTASRIGRYGEQIGSYTILVPSDSATSVSLSDRVTACGITGVTKVGKLINLYRAIGSRVREGTCDVISADQYYLGALACYFGWRHDVGVEVAALGFEKFTWWRRLVAGFVLRRADVIRINGTYMQKFLETEFGISDGRVQIIPIYIDIVALGLDTTSRESVTRSDTEFRFLTVSRLVPIKRIDTQIRAIAELRVHFPQAHLHIVGDGPERASLEALCEELQLTETVTFHGHVTGTALGAVYQSADCFLLTSEREGWGMVLVEALAAGLPIVMTDVGAAGDLVSTEQHGLIVPVNDQAALQSAMERMLTDPALRQECVKNAQAALASLPSATDLVSAYTVAWVEAMRHRRTTRV